MVQIGLFLDVRRSTFGTLLTHIEPGRAATVTQVEPVEKFPVNKATGLKISDFLFDAAEIQRGAVAE